MNRRNFLKLFGIGLLPVPTLASPTAETPSETVGDNTDWMILETPYMGMHSVELDEPGFVSYLLSSDEVQYFRQGFTTSQFLKVSEQTLVTVIAPNGMRVWFRPMWCPVKERFKTVRIEIETCHDRFLSEDGEALLGESKTITMSACDSDGKVINQSVDVQ